MSAMQAYLAAKYMSGPKAEIILSKISDNATKKKKRKPKPGTDNAPCSFIKDADEDLRWGKPAEELEEEPEAVEVKDRSFKKRKVEPTAAVKDDAGWITIRGNEDGSKLEEDQDVPMEDVIAAPLVGGLVMPSEFQSTLPSYKSKGKQKQEEEDPGLQQETVYRDAQGRRIEVETEEQVADRKVREELEEKRKQAEKKEWTKGLKQRQDAAALREEAAKLRSKGVARHANDTELNDFQKSQERWNDPAAAFLTKTQKKGPKKPLYKGPLPPPNRFGILPGYRWDGVDRSNGFEKKYFQAKNEKGRSTLEAHQWSVEDM